MQTPLPHSFPAQSGAVLNGEILTDEEILDMDRRIIWRHIRQTNVTLPQPCPAYEGFYRAAAAASH